MKIKVNQNLYKNILIAFAGLVIFIGSLGYFLGFDINVRSLLLYIVFLISTAIVFLFIFFIVDKCNGKYIVFYEDKIMEKDKYGEKLIVYYNQILYTKYHNSVNLLYGNIDFGYVEIVYQINSKDNERKYFHIYLSKKNYKKFFVK